MFNFFNRLGLKFWNATKGFYILIKEEKSLWFHLFSTLVVVSLGIITDIDPWEWAILLITIGLVIGMEIMNTGLEYLVDLISYEDNLKAKKVKDLAAAATLFAAIISIIVGLIIFIPRLSQL